MGTVLGAAMGYTFSHLMKLTHRKGLIDRESYVAQYIALTLFTVGITKTLGSDDLLAAFAAGTLSFPSDSIPANYAHRNRDILGRTFQDAD